MKSLLDSSLSHDEILVEGDMVDSNYRYTNLPRVEAYFEAVTADMKKRVPIKVDDGFEMTSIELQPYMQTYIYTVNDVLDSEEVEGFITLADSDDFIQSYCDALYYSKHLMANNVQVNIMLYDLTPKLIVPTFLDRQTCS